jgi:outer membrane protein
MKRSLALIVTLASGLISSLALSANAQTPAAPAGATKVAVIAFQVAVAQTNEGQRDFADLQKKFDPKRQELKGLSDEVDNLKKQLQAQGDKLSDAERANRAKVIDDKEKKLQREAEDAQNDLQQGMQELYNNLASKVYDVLSTYAAGQGYTVVLDISASQQQAPVVLYTAESNNITKAVIDAYNVKSGVPAPPAAAAPAAAPKMAPKAPAAH